MDKPVFENDTYAMWFHGPDKVVHHEIKKALNPGDLRTILGKGVDLMRRNHAHKWLSDDKGNGAIPQADSQWAMDTFVPQAVQAGWKFWAIIQPDQAVGKLQMKRFIDANAKVGLTVRTFPNADAAMTWLKSC